VAVSDGTPAIEFDGVSFWYRPGVPVLTDASFRVDKGSTVCVIGPNGGGKTTLLYLALGLLRPGSGTVRVLGTAPESARKQIGYMPQHADFDDNFPVSVREVVLMGRLRNGLFCRYGRADRDAAAGALEEMGVADLARRPFAALSGGQRQRVLIARALASHPQLLLLDEPTAYVDPAFAEQFYEIVRRLKERLTVVMVSHDLGVVSEGVDSVICVNRRVRVHPTSDLTGEVIQALYGSPHSLVRHDHCCSERGHANG
jgi:zinc transport system ATP-binding protein